MALYILFLSFIVWVPCYLIYRKINSNKREFKISVTILPVALINIVACMDTAASFILTTTQGYSYGEYPVKHGIFSRLFIFWSGVPVISLNVFEEIITTHICCISLLILLFTAVYFYDIKKMNSV